MKDDERECYCNDSSSYVHKKEIQKRTWFVLTSNLLKLNLTPPVTVTWNITCLISKKNPNQNLYLPLESLVVGRCFSTSMAPKIFPTQARIDGVHLATIPVNPEGTMSTPNKPATKKPAEKTTRRGCCFRVKTEKLGLKCFFVPINAV